MSSAELVQRLVAILAADAVGYSRLMAADERATVASLDASRVVFRSNIESRHGRVVDMAGDSVLAVFDTAAGAVSAALAIQCELKARVASEEECRRMRFRIGVHLGDVFEKADGSIYGDGVNIAARLEQLAEPSGVLVSESIRYAVKGKVSTSFEDKGKHHVKNILDPVHVFAVALGGSTLIAATGVDVTKPVSGFGGRPAIAVLPFENMSGDLNQDYFTDGLTEDVLTRLAIWRWVPVIARNSSFSFKGRAVDVKAIGVALGARYVLEGSVRRVGNRVRVTGQLIDAETGHHLWAERYDRVLEDLFAIQDELTDGIVAALEAALGQAEAERARKKPPESLDAWDAFQRGWWHIWRFTREDFVAAVPFFRRAAELDPHMAQPHSGIALVRVFEAFFLWTPKPAEAFAEAVVSARAAMALDDRDAAAYWTLGGVLAFSRRLDDALLLCKRAVALNPSDALGYAALCTAHLFRGEFAEGIRTNEAAIRISPNDPLLHIWLGTLSACHYMARNYEKAAEVARLAVQRAPRYPIGWRSFANALGQLGRMEEAREALARFLALMPGYSSEEAARASVGFIDESLLQHYLEGLRKAGWQG
ncbi:MAG: adenylate/guanylate cyclase domain-containing protein [Caldimonas sp.]